MNAHTIRDLREQAREDGRSPKPLVYSVVDDDLVKVSAQSGGSKRISVKKAEGSLTRP